MMKRGLIPALALVAAYAAFCETATPAHAGGGRVFQFGGPLPTFKATRHPKGAASRGHSSSYGYARRKAEKRRAAAAAKARALARQKAIAKQKAMAAAEARKQREAEKRAARLAAVKAEKKALEKRQSERSVRTAADTAKAADDRASESSPLVNAPSTSVLLTQQEVLETDESNTPLNTASSNANMQGSKPEGTVEQMDKVKTAATATQADDALKTGEALAVKGNTESDDNESACKKFIPEVGLTISIDC